MNTEVHRQKFKNVQRDPRVTLTIRNEQDPYHYAEACEHIDQLSQKYHAGLQPRRHKERAGDALDRP